MVRNLRIYARKLDAFLHMQQDFIIVVTMEVEYAGLMCGSQTRGLQAITVT